MKQNDSIIFYIISSFLTQSINIILVDSWNDSCPDSILDRQASIYFSIVKDKLFLILLLEVLLSKM